ncbi:MAG: metallophosphoesterase family protein [Pyrinomonadaceae bacterium]
MSEHLIGVISDTHGLLRPEAVKALRGVEMILHAGDIGKPEIISELENIATVTAVRGNNDRDEWAAEIPETQIVQIGGVLIYMLHDFKELGVDPAEEKHRVVVSGHSHMPSIYRRSGLLYLNPGSAGRRRFKLPVCVALLSIKNGETSGEIVELSV